MPDTTVRYYASTMTGAPTLSRTGGALITVLDACLINGFGSVTLNSLVVASNVATGSISTGHGFAMSGDTGPVIRIAGATPSGLNGDWRVASVPGSTTFTFVTSGISDQTASGTITAKRAPLGFTKAYSGTNKAAYQADRVSGLRHYLRVDDADTQNAIIRGYVTMSDVDTGTDAFPASATYMYKIDNIRANAPWWLVGDDQAFYLFARTNSNGIVAGGMFFGALAYPIAASDAYASGLIGNANVLEVEATYDAAMPRSYTQLAGVKPLYRYTHRRYNTCAYPCPVNNGILAAPVEAWESTTLPRGMMPGMYLSLNVYSGYSNLAVFNNVAGLSRTLIFCEGYLQGALFDITGPWR